MSTTQALSWKPRLRGNIYCAPACGGNCTRSDYEKAVRAADALIRKLRGNGWKPLVWENLGWHYKVVSGPIQVYPSHDRKSYSAMIGGSPKDNAGDASYWHPPKNKTFTDPNDAVEYALRYAVEFTDGIEQTLKAAERAAGIRRETLR